VAHPRRRRCSSLAYDELVAAIQAQGICAKDDNEEIAVKNSNAFDEQYNIWTSGGYVRRSYITTCFPAQF
jgi:hypothetical protein